MTKQEIKQKLLQNGVKNLIEFGYPDVNTENILTDIVYSDMFKSMLNDNKGYKNDIDEAIEELLDELPKN